MKDQIKKIIIDHVNLLLPGEGQLAPISSKAKLEDDLSYDSLSITELIVNLEDTFDIEVSELEEANLKTVQDVVDLVQRLRAES